MDRQTEALAELVVYMAMVVAWELSEHNRELTQAVRDQGVMKLSEMTEVMRSVAPDSR